MHSKQKRWRQFRVQTGSPLLPSVSRQMAQDDNSDDDELDDEEDDEDEDEDE